MSRPKIDEYPTYFAKYIDLVSEDDIMPVLAVQLDVMNTVIAAVPHEREMFAYAAGKWTIRQVLGHLGDVERVFGYRALRFSRADETPLPGFDENTYVDHSAFNDTSVADLMEEFAFVRRANIALLSRLRADQWSASGIANGNPISIRALAYVMVAHVRHHLNILRDRYGIRG